MRTLDRLCLREAAMGRLPKEEQVKIYFTIASDKGTGEFDRDHAQRQLEKLVGDLIKPGKR